MRNNHDVSEVLGEVLTFYSSINLMAVLTTPSESAFYFAMDAFLYGAGCILGPVVGGLLADSPATWRWVRLIKLTHIAYMSLY